MTNTNTYIYVIITGLKARKNSNENAFIRKEGVGTKSIHAYGYILDVAKSEMVDRSAFQGHGNDIYLPYSKVLFFYGEYDYYCLKHNLDVPSEATFRRAFKEVQANLKNNENVSLRLSGGKGVLLSEMMLNLFIR
jgi:hypothetical protein